MSCSTIGDWIEIARHFSSTHLLTIQAGWGLLSIPCISKFSVCISCCYHSWQRNSWCYLNIALPFRAFTVVLNCKWRKCSNYSYRCSSWRPDLYNLTERIWIWTHLSVLVLHKCIHGRTSSDLSQSNGEKNLSHGCFAAAELIAQSLLECQIVCWAMDEKGRILLGLFLVFFQCSLLEVCLLPYQLSFQFIFFHESISCFSWKPVTFQ